MGSKLQASSILLSLCSCKAALQQYGVAASDKILELRHCCCSKSAQSQGESVTHSVQV